MAVRGVTFDKQLNKSEDDAHRMNYFFQGEMGITKGCEISENANGDLVISDGYFDIYGRLVANVGDTVVDVPDIASGVLYSILVFEVDLSKENTVEEFNQGDFKIISNAQNYPTLTQEDLENGGEVYQMEFCRFENTVAGIQKLVDNRPILDMQKYATKTELTNTINELDAHKAEMATDDVRPHGMGSIASQEYQEGIFTPDIRFGGNNTGITYTRQLGIFRRIGKVVHFEISIALSNKGTSTGFATIEGLPIATVAGSVNRAFLLQAKAYLPIEAGKEITARIQGNSSTILLQKIQNNNGYVNLKETDFVNNTAFDIQGSYII